ncbi:hypothetical protein [Vibrio rarus]|uniref:hypothetical protein n=1 Tax=Vibrio rarus TaxID=413403 RepID=UPI0021C2DEEB|nr:hypothetical protein [Vibrio rarus]
MRNKSLLLGSLLLLIQGCAATHSPTDASQSTSGAVLEAPTTNTTFSDEKIAWLASEQWSYHGNGLVNNIGWNDRSHKGDTNLVARYSTDPTTCQGTLFITGPFYGNRISGIFNVNGQDVHFKFVSKANANARMYRAKNSEGREFLLKQFATQSPVIIQSDIGTIATFPSTGFNDARQVIDQECAIKLQREKNAL